MLLSCEYVNEKGLRIVELRGGIWTADKRSSRTIEEEERDMQPRKNPTLKMSCEKQRSLIGTQLLQNQNPYHQLTE